MPKDKLNNKKKIQTDRQSPKIILKDRVIGITDNLLLIIFSLLLFLTPLIIFTPMYNSAIIPKFVVSAFLLVILLVIFLFQLSLKNKLKLYFPLLQYSLLGLIVLYWVPSLFRETRYQSFLDGLPFLLWILAALILIQLDFNRKKIQYLVLCIIFGGGLSAIYGFLQYLNLDKYILNLDWAGRELIEKQIMISTFGNANFFAAYIVPIFILILCWWILSGKKLVWQITGIILGILILICIGLSGVRAAWVALPISLIILFYLFYLNRITNLKVTNKKIYYRISWLITAIFIIILFIFIITRFQVYNPLWLKERVQTIRNIHVLQERFLIWQITIQMIRNNPLFGMGVGQYPAQFFPTLKNFMEKDENYGYESVLIFLGGRNANQAHNDYLQISAESGLITLAIFLWILILFYYTQLRMISWIPDYTDRIKQIGLVISTIPFLIDALVSFPFYLPANGLLFWVLFGLSILHGKVVLNNKSGLELIYSIPPLARIILPPLAIIILLGLSIPIIYKGISAYYLKQGIGALQTMQGEKALTDFENAVWYNPVCGHSRFFLGKTYALFGQLNKAFIEYSKAEKYGIDDISIYEDQAVFHYRNQDYHKAMIKYHQILQIFPHHKESHRWLGEIYMNHLPNQEKAIYHLQKYLSLFPSETERKWYQERLNQLKSNQ